MNTTKGNSQALKAHKDASVTQTRHELEKAFKRLVHGNPKVEERGKKVTPASVAKEAGIDRSTLYRYHEPILTEIRRHNEETPKAKLKEKGTELAKARSKAKEYREMLEEAQTDKEALKRENYALNLRNQELEQLLRQRDELIEDLQRRLNQGPKVSPIKGGNGNESPG